VSVVEDLSDVLLDGRWAEVVSLVQKPLDEVVTPADIIEKNLRPDMGEVGELSSRGEFFLPQRLL
jgi:methanogenic corrinoid protein MtbC1